jgi:hypothetical protein
VMFMRKTASRCISAGATGGVIHGLNSKNINTPSKVKYEPLDNSCEPQI